MLSASATLDNFSAVNCAPTRTQNYQLLVIGLPEAERGHIESVVAGVKEFRCETKFVRDASEFLRYQRENSTDLLIIDTASLPAYQLRTVMQAITEDHRLRHAPICFVCDSGAEHGLQYCATHYHGMFIRKSLPAPLVRANIEMALARLQRETENERMRLAIEEALDRTRSELDVAKRILDNIASKGVKSNSHARIHLQSVDRLNGDIALIQRAPSGNTVVLVGDFSGHGLTAAVGGMIASDAFIAMAAKGYGIDEIAAQINRKLHRILPTGLYLAACLLEWDLNQGVMSIWSGGLPDVIVRSQSIVAPVQIADGHPALGVLNPADFSTSLRRVAIYPGDRAYIYTDGLTEMRDAGGRMWGNGTLAGVIRNTKEPEAVFDAILAQASAHCGSATPQDDVTLVELMWPENASGANSAHESTELADLTDLPTGEYSAHVITSDFSLRLNGSSISNADVVPALVQLVSDLKIGEECRPSIFVILRELMTNAIDHGLLGLNSSMKSTADGFDEYYALRESKLAALKDGYVSLRLVRERSMDDRYDALRIRIEDSGPGFDHRSALQNDSQQALKGEAMSGRGLMLLKTLCASLNYSERGNAVEVVFNLAPGNKAESAGANS